MITPSIKLRKWIEEFSSLNKAANALGVSRQALWLLINNKCSAGEDFISKVNEKLGWKFDDAFEIVKEDSK